MGFDRPVTIEVEKRDLVQIRHMVEEMQKHISDYYEPENLALIMPLKQIEDKIEFILGLKEPKHEVMD